MARDRKTAPAEQPDKLPELTVPEQKLIEALADGCSNTEAYRRSYGQNDNSDASLHVLACRKVAEEKIQAHLHALQQVGLTKAKLSREQWIEMMLSAAMRAETSGNHGAAATYRTAVGKSLGYQVEKTEDVTQHDPLQTLSEIAQYSPELAQSLAKQSGIQWQATDEDTVH